MSSEGLIPVNFLQEKHEQTAVLIRFEPGRQHYRFSFESSDASVKFRMDESDRAFESSDFVKADYAEGIEESYKVYYSLAAASGVLTGGLSCVHLTEEQLRKIDQWKQQNWEKIIIAAACFAGCKKADYKSAAAWLMKHAVKVTSENQKAREWTTILAEHPSQAGVLLAMLSQFSGQSLRISESGKLSLKKLPGYYFIGQTTAEKIIAALFYWLFALADAKFEEQGPVLEEIGLNGELLEKISQFVNLPFLKEIPLNREDAEKKYSAWLKETVTRAARQDARTVKDWDTITELMHTVLCLADQALPVLANEAVIHGLYLLQRVLEECRAREVRTFENLMAIPAEDLMQTNERLLSRMCLIGSAAFAGANITAAIAKALAKEKADGKEFSKTFFTEINLVGVGRLVFAVANDSRYWGEDFKVFFQRESRKKQDTAEEVSAEDEEFEPLTLDCIQARILYCLEDRLIAADIAHTENKDAADQKSRWHELWRRQILAGVRCAPGEEDVYFTEDEELLYDTIRLLNNNSEDRKWFYLLAQELALFTPYYALGSENDAVFGKLKPEKKYDYLTERFIPGQNIVSREELDKIISQYRSYENTVSGTPMKIIGAVAVGGLITIVTGGAALTFAPNIAVLFAGEAVAGLHGAALTSASLALIGGGSLAAGGLGIAGGTAIIAGGGALIGAVGSGGISAAAIMLTVPGNYWIRQSAKLLTYCRCTLLDSMDDRAAVKRIHHKVSAVLRDTEAEIQALKEDNTSLNDVYIKKLEEYEKYLGKTESELKNLLKG